jgi:hypothetical protein
MESLWFRCWQVLPLCCGALLPSFAVAEGLLIHNAARHNASSSSEGSYNSRVFETVRSSSALHSHEAGWLTANLTGARDTAVRTGRGYAIADAAPPQETQVGDADSASGSSIQDNGSELDERLGEPPEEDYRQVFLREVLVLLEPGQVQLEFSLEYLRDEFSNIRTRAGSFSTVARVGLPHQIEVFLDLPLSLSKQEAFASEDGITSIEEQDSGIGDVSAGLNFALVRESANWPHILGTLIYSEPTGDDVDPTGPLGAVLGPGAIALNQGRRSATAGVTLVRSSDPAVLFGGFLFTYFDDESVSGVEIEDGHLFIYRFGMGFAVNDQLTLSGLFSGAFKTQTKLEGERVLGSDVEPMTLRSGLTYAFSRNQYIEPAVTFGLNDDAADAVLNLAYLITF